jgi:putative transposase
VDRVFPQRRVPAKGVQFSLGGLNWVFLTVCTERREAWLAQASVQRVLHDVWKNTATAWLVSDYLLMPDHLHLFCAPHDLKFGIERWIGFWKDRFTKIWKGGDRLARVHENPTVEDHRPAAKSVGTHCRVRVGTEALTPYRDSHIIIGKFQRGGFHHRLRGAEGYRQKWQYVRENPVRAGLAPKPEDWPYQGRVHEIHW